MRYFIVILIFLIFSSTAFTQTTFIESASSWGLDLGTAKDGGLSFADFDGDGDLDLLVNTSNPTSDSRLYRNNGNNTFSDVTSAIAPALLNNNRERSAVWGDVNNDGRLDFMRNTATSGLEVYIQASSGVFGDGTGSTTPITINSSNVSNGVNTEGCGLVDFDGDGDLDIIFDNHNYGIDIMRNNYVNHLTGAVVNPAASGLFTHATPGTTPILGLNQSATDGDYGSFTDVNDDGWVDIFMRKTDENDFFLNQGGTFTNGADLAQANNGNKGAVALYDYDNDGDFDAFWTENDLNQIFRNDGGGTWTALGAATGIPTGFTGNRIDEVVCGDIDNDGDIDIMLVGNNQSYMYINQINDPSGGINAGSAMSFVLDNTNSFNSKDGEGAVMVDIDGDSDLDIYMNINNGSNQLWINQLYSNSTTGPNKTAMFVEVLDNRSNYMQTGKERPALGATIVLLDCNDNVLSGIREVNGGNGHGTQDPTNVHFGLPWGNNYNYKVLVRYPNYSNGGIVREEVRRWINPLQAGSDPVTITIRPDDADVDCPVILEVCNNGIDDDTDGDTDYEDDDCDCDPNNFSTPVDLYFDSYSIISGNGLQQGNQIRYSNVATIGNQNIDAIATVNNLSNLTTLAELESESGFAVVTLPDMNAGMGTLYEAEVQYDLVQSGTTIPVTASFEIEITDLDHSSRTESIVVPQSEISNYYLNDPTNLTTTFTGGNLIITGTQSQNITDPEAAVKFVYSSRNSFTINYRMYQTGSSATGRSGFASDGHKFSMLSECLPSEICNNGSDDDNDGLTDLDDPNCACNGGGQNPIWLVDEETGTDHLALWSFVDYSDANTGTDYGRLQYRHPTTGAIRDADDASSMEAMAVNPYTGIAYFLSNGDVDNGPGGAALFTYDLNDAANNVNNIILTVIGHINEPSGENMEALVFDPTTNRLYTSDPVDDDGNNGTTTDQLYYIDLNSLNADPMQLTSPTLVGTISGAGHTNNYVDGMEFDDNGNLYVIDGTDDHLYRINPATAAIISVIDDNLAGGTGHSSVDIETIAWDAIAQQMLAIDNSNEEILLLDMTQNGNNTVLMDYTTAAGMPSGADFEGSAILNPCINKVSLGNLVFQDTDGDNTFDNGEGIDNVIVELYQSGANVTSSSPIAKDTTSSGGVYFFENLTEGDYFVHIPASEFGASEPLENLVSVANAQGDNGTDNDDNGQDDANPATNGISSVTITLTNDGEPTNGTTETGSNNTIDDADDNNGDMTIDFGFVSGIEICNDGQDNDGDGLIDCADSDCAAAITNVTITQPTCANKTSGQIIITANGSGTLEYSILNEAAYQSSNTFSNLGIGQYTVRVRNSSGCVTSYTSNPVILQFGTCTENCTNGIDDDGDGLIDCDDPDCDDVGTGNTINN